MGVLTLTPQYIDYANGSTWASLGANEAATKTVIQNVLNAFQSAFATAGTDRSLNITFGVNAVGISATDVTTGTSVSSGAGNSPASGFFANYSAYRTALLAVPTPNSIQQVAWNSTNLPSTDPIAAYGGPFYTSALCNALGTFNSPANTIVGSVGFAVASYPDLDPNGLGTGFNLYNGIAHEVSEVLGRWDNMVVWWYSSNGVRDVSPGYSTRYVSPDGTTASKYYDMNNTGSGDNFDFLTGQGTAFCYVLEAGPVSRSAALPLKANDWAVMTILGWPLTATGQAFAGIGNSGTVNIINTVAGVGSAQAVTVGATNLSMTANAVGFGPVPTFNGASRIFGHM